VAAAIAPVSLTNVRPLRQCLVNTFTSWVQSMWAERKRQEKVLNAQSISRTSALRSVTARHPRSAHAPSFSVASAHRSVPAHPRTERWAEILEMPWTLSTFSCRSRSPNFRPAPFTLHLFSSAIMSYLFPEIDLYSYFLRSVPAPQLPTPRSAHAPSFSVTSAHCSVPAQPIFGQLRSVSAPLTCSVRDMSSV